MKRNKEIGLMILRCTVGLILFFQGYGKVFDIGVDVLHEKMFVPTYDGLLPNWPKWATAYVTSYIELIGGLLLILGLFRDWRFMDLAWCYLLFHLDMVTQNQFGIYRM